MCSPSPRQPNSLVTYCACLATPCVPTQTAPSLETTSQSVQSYCYLHSTSTRKCTMAPALMLRNPHSISSIPYYSGPNTKGPAYVANCGCQPINPKDFPAGSPFNFASSAVVLEKVPTTFDAVNFPLYPKHEQLATKCSSAPDQRGNGPAPPTGVPSSPTYWCTLLTHLLV